MARRGDPSPPRAKFEKPSPRTPREWSEFQQNMRKAISFAELFAMRNKHPNMGWDGIHNDIFFDERTKRHIVGDAKKYHFDILKASNRKCIGLGALCSRLERSRGVSAQNLRVF